MSRTHVITGSASGIGQATAQRLLSHGQRVIGVDLRDADVEADLSTSEGRAEAIARICDLAPDGIDGLLTSAGASDPEKPGLACAVNFFGTTDLVTGLRPAMRAPGARVVVVSSAGQLQSNQDTVELERLCLEGDEQKAVALAQTMGTINVYPGTKHALAVWARRTAVQPDWAGSGVLINIVGPGVINTPMTAKSALIPEMAEKIRKTAPRATTDVGQPEEVAELMDFLLNCQTGYIVGQTIFIDGGTEALLRPEL